MKESWKPVCDYEGFYEVSDKGRLRRIATPTGKSRNRIIVPVLKRDGYLDYWLWLKGRAKRIKAHRLVWESFVSGIPAGLCINHKNGRKTDNRLSNLEVVTYSQNAIHSFRVLGRKAPNNPSRGMRNGSARLDDDKVREIRKLYGTGPDQYDLAREFGVCQRTINLVVRRKTWGHVE